MSPEEKAIREELIAGFIRAADDAVIEAFSQSASEIASADNEFLRSCGIKPE